MTPKELFDFAVSNVAIHDKQLALAREGALHSDDEGVQQWVLHVKKVLLRRYRRELHEPVEGMTNREIEIVAVQLRDYYAKLIKKDGR